MSLIPLTVAALPASYTQSSIDYKEVIKLKDQKFFSDKRTGILIQASCLTDDNKLAKIQATVTHALSNFESLVDEAHDDQRKQTYLNSVLTPIKQTLISKEPRDRLKLYCNVLSDFHGMSTLPDHDNVPLTNNGYLHPGVGLRLDNERPQLISTLMHELIHVVNGPHGLSVEKAFACPALVVKAELSATTREAAKQICFQAESLFDMSPTTAKDYWFNLIKLVPDIMDHRYYLMTYLIYSANAAPVVISQIDYQNIFAAYKKTFSPFPVNWQAKLPTLVKMLHTQPRNNDAIKALLEEMLSPTDSELRLSTRAQRVSLRYSALLYIYLQVSDAND